jgi:hypothetical protein
MATQKQLANLNMYREMTDIKLKATITLVLLSCYVIVLFFLIYLVYLHRPFENMKLIGTIETILTFALPFIFRHFFPSRSPQ